MQPSGNPGLAKKSPASGSNASPASGDQSKEKKRKETILDLSRYLDKTIKVKFFGGREASGVLKGYDQLINLVLDNTVEYLRGKVPYVIYVLSDILSHYLRY